MYSGIVTQFCSVKDLVKRPGLFSFDSEFSPELLKDLEVGASVAFDGVCLTVTNIDDSVVSFDIMQKTLETTTLGDLKINDYLNVERSMKSGDEVGGHLISGHIDGKAEITDIYESPNNRSITFQLPHEAMKYLFKKGFIALNGCSLTIAEIDKGQNLITIWFIPETLRKTTFGEKKVGDKVNFEIERQTQVMVDTIERVLKRK